MPVLRVTGGLFEGRLLFTLRGLGGGGMELLGAVLDRKGRGGGRMVLDDGEGTLLLLDTLPARVFLVVLFGDDFCGMAGLARDEVVAATFVRDILDVFECLVVGVAIVLLRVIGFTVGSLLGDGEV